MNNSGDMLRFASAVAGLPLRRGGRPELPYRDFVASPSHG